MFVEEGDAEGQIHMSESRVGRTSNSRPHLVCLIIQAIFSVVHWLPEVIRSPSFSRFSSSITTRNSPAAKAASASSIGSKENSVRAGASRTSVGRQTWVFECGLVGDGVAPLVPFIGGMEGAEVAADNDLTRYLVPLVRIGEVDGWVAATGAILTWNVGIRSMGVRMVKKVGVKE